MTRGLYLLAKTGGMPLAAGPASKAPWWWSQIAYHERRIEGIQELSALDADSEPPARYLWYSGAHRELKGWIEDRKKRREPQ